MITQQTLIIGANSAIAQAIGIEHGHLNNSEIVLISRGFSDSALSTYQNLPNARQISVEDYSASSIELAITQIQAESTLPITNVFVCNGILHTCQRLAKSSFSIAVGTTGLESKRCWVFAPTSSTRSFCGAVTGSKTRWLMRESS